MSNCNVPKITSLVGAPNPFRSPLAAAPSKVTSVAQALVRRKTSELSASRTTTAAAGLAAKDRTLPESDPAVIWIASIPVKLTPVASVILRATTSKPEPPLITSEDVTVLVTAKTLVPVLAEASIVSVAAVSATTIVFVPSPVIETVFVSVPAPWI